MYQSEVLEGWTVQQASGYAGAAEPVAGVLGTGGSSIGFDDPLLSRHILFLGGIGTGKTVGMSALVRSLRERASSDDVFVFFDTKGDYHAEFFREGDVTLGTDETFGGHRRWNLFREFDSVPLGDLADEVNEAAATLLDGVGESAGDNNRFWTAMAQDLLGAVVLSLARGERSRSGLRYSNADIRAVADKWTIDDIRRTVGAHSDLQGTLQYIASDRSTTTNSVQIFLQQAIRQVFASTFSRPGDFSVRHHLRGKAGRGIFLEYDIARGGTLSPIYRTLVDTALKESLARKRASGRVFFVLDEFSLLPRLRHLDAGLNFGRSLGLRFVVGTQNVGQVLSAYEDSGGGSILSGFGSVFAFRLFDHDSREYVRGRFGTNRRLVRYDAALRSRGVGEQLVDGSVVEDWDLTGLGVGQCIVGLPDNPPVRFQFAPPEAGRAG